MAKGKHVKKEKSKKKKSDEDRNLKDIDNQKDKDADIKKIDESELELARLQNLQRLEIQRQETCERLRLIKCAVLKLRQERWDENMWNRYMSCDGRPSLEDVRQINAFISKWLNDENKISANPSEILVQCDSAFELLSELQEMKFEVDDVTLKDAKYEQLQLDLKDALKTKIDMATFESLLDTSMNIDPDTGNSLILLNNKTVTMAIWANLVCNPRYNGLNLAEMDVAFTVPRDIVSGECAVRVMKTDFDHFSPTSNHFRCLNISAFTCDVKESLRISETGKKLEVVNEDWDDGSIDLLEYFTVGPILSLQLVAVPSQPRKVKNWIITKVEDENCLKYLPWRCNYVPPGLMSEGDESKKDDEEEAELERQRALNEMSKLVLISWKLPGDIIFCDVPKLARWDDEKRQWTSSGLIDVNYKEEASSISFYTSYFGAFSILQPKFVSFPYQSWDLTPIVDENNSYKLSFSITTMTGSVEILIKGQECRLVQVMSNEKLYLESLYDVPLKPSELLNKLQAVGLFITCNRDDYVLTNSIKAKNHGLEDRVYKQVALVCAEYKIGFMHSRWNSSVGADKIVVRLQDGSQWNSKMSQTVAVVTDNEAAVLAITELSQNYEDKYADNQIVCADMYHLVESRRRQTVNEGFSLEKDKESHVFMNTVYQMLATVRIFCC